MTVVLLLNVKDCEHYRHVIVVSGDEPTARRDDRSKRVESPPRIMRPSPQTTVSPVKSPVKLTGAKAKSLPASPSSKLQNAVQRF